MPLLVDKHRPRSLEALHVRAASPILFEEMRKLSIEQTVS